MMKVIALLALASVAFASMNMYAEVAGSTKHLYQWTKTNFRPHSSEQITIGFAIKQKNLYKLEDIFWAVSNPESTSFGKYLTNEELGELIGTDDETLHAVQKWLNDHNAQSVTVSSTRDYVWGTLSVEAVETLLSIEVSVYSYQPVGSKNRALITRSEDSPLIPAHLAASIDFVSGLWHFPATKDMLKSKSPLSIEQAPIDPFMPVWALIGVPKGALVEYLPICSAGLNISEDVYHPCSDYGNPITSYNFTWAQFDYNKGKMVAGTAIITEKSANWPNCTIIDGIFGGETICTFVVGGLLDDSYIQANSSFSYCFQDGSCTAPATWGLQVVPSQYRGPTDVRDYYGVPKSLVAGSKNSSQAVVEFLMQFYSPSDLAAYFKMFNLPNYSVYKVVGPNFPPGPGVEASLDIQYIMGVGQGVNTWFWSMTGNDWVAEWAQSVLNAAGAPKVHSISYGEDEGDVDLGYYNRSETELQKLGATGHSILVSSGDSGVSACDVFIASWPASSPHVTAVGATRITRGATPACQMNPAGSGCNEIGEVSASADLGIFWTTGGGFSGYALRPSYQDTVVSKYLAGSNVPDTSVFNSTGRAYPDVVTVGHYLQVVNGGVVMPVDGTSASSPIFAGMIGLINDQRLKAGKQTLGFLNQWLYSLDPSAFYDVTVGDTNLCENDVCCSMPSFYATTGWDPASGLGSPRFPTLLKAALALQ